MPSVPPASPAVSQGQVRPAALARPLVLLFAIAAGISVANVYYAQPLLDALAADFGIATASAGVVVTATQAGSTLALLLLVPLGDLLPRRALMLWQAAALALCLLALAASASVWTLLAGMLAAGMLGTAMTQGLISYAAALSAPSQRGSVLGTVQSGVVIGLLLARVVSGALADLGGWRLVYVCSAALIALLGAALARTLPPSPAPAAVGGYLRLLGSMGGLLRHDRALQLRGVLALLMFAVLNIFWSALVLPLSAPPHSLSHGAIGAFGLVGVIGVLGGARAGSWADRGLAQHATGAALLLLVAAWWPLSFTDTSLWTLAGGILVLDIGAQMIHVTNQSLILRTRPEAHSRMIGCYMMFYAVGSGAGALAGTHMYAYAGWNGVCLLGAAVSLAALCWWAATLKLMPRQVTAA
ncbi:MFS transporter [Herbaspirillum sp. WKF16]|uniref:MFS transporter n=1 Tax=Herbaspirillum sp. WKF16 TaxID=3028312 RepID=UPI0023A9FDAF|nr:MFS transporter [Herbaspirillum sp. WKF16]WDZ96276.1 MFS transporter [Herbaspirillum sp. WKF16]